MACALEAVPPDKQADMAQDAVVQLKIRFLSGELQIVGVLSSTLIGDLEQQLAGNLPPFYQLRLLSGQSILSRETVADLAPEFELQALTVLSVDSVFESALHLWRALRWGQGVLPVRGFMSIDSRPGWRYLLSIDEDDPRIVQRMRQFSEVLELLAGTEDLESRHCNQLWYTFGLPMRVITASDMQADFELFSGPSTHPTANHVMLTFLAAVGRGCRDMNSQMPMLEAMLQRGWAVEVCCSFIVLDFLSERSQAPSSIPRSLMAHRLGKVMDELPLRWLLFSKGASAGCRLLGRHGEAPCLDLLDMVESLGLPEVSGEAADAAEQVRRRTGRGTRTARLQGVQMPGLQILDAALQDESQVQRFRL